MYRGVWNLGTILNALVLVKNLRKIKKIQVDNHKNHKIRKFCLGEIENLLLSLPNKIRTP